MVVVALIQIYFQVVEGTLDSLTGQPNRRPQELLTPRVVHLFEKPLAGRLKGNVAAVLLSVIQPKHLQ